MTATLLRVGSRRPHVFLVSQPGATAVRLAAEQELRRRQWPAVASPADADVLLVAGAVTSDYTGIVDAIWRAMPAPRAWSGALHVDEVPEAMEGARRQIGDVTAQRVLASTVNDDRHGPNHASERDPRPDGCSEDGDDVNAGASQQGAAESPSADGHGHESGGEPGSHSTGEGGSDEHGQEIGGMQMPGGLPMADRAADRDGLKLDRLHLALGPVLPDWPAGLVLRVALQGDVVQHASVESAHPRPHGESFWTEPWRRAAAGEAVTVGDAARRRVAAHLDSLGRLLAVAGWDAAAVAARRWRDEALTGTPASTLRPAVGRFGRRVARSRVLAWSTRRLGVLTADDAVAAGVCGPALRAAGDVTARYRRWCADLTELAAALDDDAPLDPAGLEAPRGSLDGGRGPSAALLTVLPDLVQGAELAAVRLIVASLDPDLDELSAAVAVGHGG